MVGSDTEQSGLIRLPFLERTMEKNIEGTPTWDVSPFLWAPRGPQDWLVLSRAAWTLRVSIDVVPYVAPQLEVFRVLQHGAKSWQQQGQ